MNEHFKQKDNPDMAMTTEEAVAKGAKLFADAEAALAKLSAQLPGIFAAVRDGGNLGGIECMQLTASSGSDVNAALGIIADLHRDLTERAKEKGIDLPTIASGGR